MALLYCAFSCCSALILSCTDSARASCTRGNIANTKIKTPINTPELDVKPSIIDNELNNKEIVLTKFRDIKLAQKIKELGGILSDSVNINTFVVIVKENIDEETTKTKKAKKLNIPIMSKSMFEEKYQL